MNENDDDDDDNDDEDEDAEVCAWCSGDTEVREQRDEHSSVHVCTSSILAAQLPRRLHVVTAVRRRKRHVQQLRTI